MAIELIAKIKPKNNGNFSMVDAIDVEMKDGSDLQTTIDILKQNSSTYENEFSFEVDGEMTSEYDISINTKEIFQAYGGVYGEIYNQFVTMFNVLQSAIDKQQTIINNLEARVFSLEQNIVRPPSNNNVISMIDYNGDILTDYSGNIIVDYIEKDYVQLVDYNNDILIDYDNNILIEYKIDDIDNIDYLVDYSKNFLIDYNKNYIMERNNINGK